MIPFGASCVRAHDDGFLVVHVLLDPAEHRWLCVEIVDRDVEETLDLRGMEVNRNNMTTARICQRICRRDAQVGVV